MTRRKKGEGKMVTFENVKEETDAQFKWLDISSEEWRAYKFPDGRDITINNPVALSLTTMSGPPQYGGGAHRIVDAEGLSHYIPRGWLKLTWKAHPFYEF